MADDKVNIRLINAPGRMVELTLDDAEIILNNLRIAPATRDLFYRIAGLALELQADKFVTVVNDIMEQKRLTDGNAN